MRTLKFLFSCERGAVAVEYSVIVGAMFLALVPGFIYVAAAMGTKYSGVTSYFNGF